MVESISKSRVTRAQAEAVVARSFGPGVALVSADECEQGWFNAVHRLGLDDGRTVIMKTAPPPDVRVLRYEADVMRAEVDALRLVRSRTTAPVPDVLAWDDTRDLIPSPYFVMSACQGVLLSERRNTLSEGEASAIDRQVARLLADVNTITGDAFGRPAPKAVRFGSWREAFTSLVSDLLADATEAGADLPVPAPEIAALVAEHEDALDAVAMPRLVHWDLWDPNVFVAPEQPTVTGIIDFERVLWADPLMEAQFTHKRAHDDIVEAYGPRLFDEPFAVERRRLYDLYLFLVMLVECSYRNYPTPDIEDFARACLPPIIDEIRNA